MTNPATTPFEKPTDELRQVMDTVPGFKTWDDAWRRPMTVVVKVQRKWIVQSPYTYHLPKGPPHLGLGVTRIMIGEDREGWIIAGLIEEWRDLPIVNEKGEKV